MAAKVIDWDVKHQNKQNHPRTYLRTMRLLESSTNVSLQSSQLQERFDNIQCQNIPEYDATLKLERFDNVPYHNLPEDQKTVGKNWEWTLP